jgi:RNA polymerase sigma-70 factor (ECF subfamily)
MATPVTSALDNSSILQFCLNQMTQGDEKAIDLLIDLACERLTRLTRHMLKDFSRVRRWEETDDVFQNVIIRMSRALRQTSPAKVSDFFGLAAHHIRCELIDLARHYFGPHGLGNHYLSDENKPGPSNQVAALENTDEPGQLAMWTEFHEKVGALPEEQRGVFDLLWYQGLSQDEAAQVISVSTRTIQRRWRDACLSLYRSVKDVPSAI